MQAPCIECESDEIRVDVREGTIVCMNCGRVNQHGLIDETYESRNFSKDFTSKGGDSGKRIGGANNYLLDNGGLGTQMGGIIMGDGRFPAYANRFYNSGPGKSLDQAFSEIDQYCNDLLLNQRIAEQAKYYYKLVLESKQHKVIKRVAVIAAILFKTSREQGQPVSLKEIRNHLQLEKREITKCFNIVQKVTQEFSPANQNNLFAASKFADQIAGNLKLREAERRNSAEIAKRSIEANIVTGKDPNSVASAAIYMAAKLAADKNGLTQLQDGERKNINYKVISVRSQMKDITIRNCYRDLFQRKEDLCHELADPARIASLPEP